jgi:hypothetical protein
MRKKKPFLDFTKKEPLIERQRRLWSHSEAIELAQQREEPLPAEVSEWLHTALKNIACGNDANEVFNVVPEKRGVRKDSFLREKQRKITNGYIAAGTADTSDGQPPKRLPRQSKKSVKPYRVRKSLRSERTGISDQLTANRHSP